MNTLANEKPGIFQHRTDHKVPQSPRGRALYTIDYFLNGKPVLNNHDNPRVQLRNGLQC